MAYQAHFKHRSRIEYLGIFLLFTTSRLPQNTHRNEGIGFKKMKLLLRKKMSTLEPSKNNTCNML